MALFLTTPPEGHPVTLAQAKLRLRIDHDDEDEAIEGLVSAATAAFERETGHALLTQTWQISRDAPERITSDGRRAFSLPLHPVASLIDLEMTSRDGIASQVPEAAIAVHLAARPARIEETRPGLWPAGDLAPGGLRATFVAGFGGAEDVPADIKEAILGLIELLYDGEDSATAKRQRLLAPFQEVRF